MWLLSKCHLQTVQLNKITVMKKALITLVCIICGLSASAQECTMCGDWVGVYSFPKYDKANDRLVDAQRKMFIRIKKNGEHYSVRIKTRYVDEPGDYVYLTEWELYSAYENKIVLKWEVGKSDNGGYGYDSFAYSLEVVYAAIEYRNGTLLFDGGTVYAQYYDKNGNLIKKNTYQFEKPFTLYKEDDDW